MFILELSMLSNMASDERKSTNITVEDVNHVIIKREELDFLTSFIDDTEDRYFTNRGEDENGII